MKRYILTLLLAASCFAADDTITISKPNYRLDIIKKGFRYSFTRPDGSVILPPHASSGLVFSVGAVADTVLRKDGTLEVTNDQGVKAKVEIEASEHHVRFSVTPGHNYEIK
jgi:hypothetical protein